MLIAEILQQGKDELEKNRVSNAEIDAQLLLGHCLKKNRSQLFLAAAQPVDQADANYFWSLIKRRSKREPVAYILSEREFWSLPFYVDREVLIPRPETEFLLESVLQKIKQKELFIDSAVDLCCGSGVIGIVLARELNARVLAIDCSVRALEVTRNNCRRHGVEELVSPIVSDLFSGIEHTRFPLIVSNPPYVRELEKEEIQSNVLDHEPHSALFVSDTDPLVFYRAIGKLAYDNLSGNGRLFFEINQYLGKETIQLLKEIGFTYVELRQDIFGNDRMIKASR